MASLAAVREDGERMEHSMDALEARMLADQENVHLWAELARRHQHVSAIALKNQGGHFDQMVRLLATQQEKARMLRRRRVATVSSVLTRPGQLARYSKR